VLVFGSGVSVLISYGATVRPKK